MKVDSSSMQSDEEDGEYIRAIVESPSCAAVSQVLPYNTHK